MVHILQLLCPRRHCYTAAAWDDAAESLAGAAYRLGRATAALTLVDPACAICGATDFQLEDGVTRFKTLEEARPHLEREQLLQQITRERLKGSN